MRNWHASLLAIALSVPWAVAVPPAPPGYTPSPAVPQAPWRRIADSIISRIWSKEHETQSHSGNIRQRGRIADKSSSRTWARYGEDIVLRFNLSTAVEARAIAEAASDLYLDIWEFNDDWVDIRLAKNDVPLLLGLLPDSLQNSHAPLMPQSGLAEIISHTSPSSHQLPFTPTLDVKSKNLFFSDYQPLSVIQPWMSLMASMFSTHVRLINIGITWEGRDIPALRVGVHPTNDNEPQSPRKTIIISGGIHSREWISTSTVLFVANKVITSFGKDYHWTNLLENFDWIFIPTLNPDGYVYTWETDRLWRKNRQQTSLRFCNGIDLDRGFGFEWDGNMSSANPCSESYAGSEPWQAVEAQRFAEWAKNETENGNTEFVALLDLHSYSQQVLYPYSYSCHADPPTLEDLQELGLGIAKAMRTTSHGHFYKTTSACEGNVAMASKNGDGKREILPRLELGGGSLLDWFYHDLGVKHAYQIKLRDTGSYGFLLPKENIVPQGRELFHAVDYLGKFFLGKIGMAKEEDVKEEVDEHAKVPSANQDDVHDGEEQGLGDDKTLIDDLGDAIQWELRRRRRR